MLKKIILFLIFFILQTNWLQAQLGNIRGTVLWDSNSNCSANTLEPKIQNQQIILNPGGLITFTDNLGNYGFNGLAFGNYTVSTINNLLMFSNSCNNNVATTLSALVPNDTIVFLDSITSNKDYYVGAIGSCLNFATNQTNVTIYYGQNTPAQNSAATVYCVFDNITKYVSGIPAHSYINGDTVFWNVLTGSLQNIIVQLNVTSTTADGTVFALNTGISNYSGVDNYLFNNTNNTYVIVCNFINTNDKKVSPQGKLTQGYTPLQQQDFTYKIRFQNKTSTQALNVVVLDSISNKLDINTFAVLDASHNYNIAILPNNVLKITFPSIMLADSSIDEANSYGFIQYKIRKKSSAISGNQIINRAQIYFDTTAITTNTTLNTLYSDLQIDSAIAKQNTNCNLPCGNGGATIFASGGVQPYTHSITNMCTNTVLNNNVISNLLAGAYIIQTTDALGMQRTKSVTILPPTPIVLNLTSVQPIGQLGSASVAPTGGTPPYDYLWLPSNFITSSITNLPAGSYTVNIVDAQGCSNGTSIVLNYATSVPNINADQFVQIFPNPATDNITIATNFDLGKIIIFTNTGQIVYAVDANHQHTISLNIQQLAAGQYNVQFGNGIIKKFLVE